MGWSEQLLAQTPRALKDQFRVTAKDIRDAKDAAGMLALVERRSNLSYEDFEQD